MSRTQLVLLGLLLSLVCLASAALGIAAPAMYLPRQALIDVTFGSAAICLLSMAAAVFCLTEGA